MSDKKSQTTQRAVLGAFSGPIFEPVDNNRVWLGAIEKMTTITFGSSGIALNVQTGEVAIPDGLALSNAARMFWQVLHDTYPNMAWRKEQ